MRSKIAHETESEQIEFVHSVFIIVYWQTVPETSRFESYTRHIIRRRMYGSNQRNACAMVYHRIGDAENAAKKLNEKYDTTNFLVKRIFQLCTPEYEPWLLKKKKRQIVKKEHEVVKLKAQRVKKQVQRKAQNTVLRISRAKKRAELRAIRKEQLERQRDYERDPIKYEYRAIEDYKSVEHLMNKKKPFYAYRKANKND